MKLSVPWWVWALVAAVAVAGVWSTFLRPPPPPEELVTQQVVEIARSAEQRKVGPILEKVSSTFHTDTGLGKDELRGILAREVVGGQWVRVFVTEIDPHLVAPDRVEVTARFVFGRSDAKQLKDLARESVLSAYEVTATSQHEADGQWRFVEAKYRQLDPLRGW